MSADDIQHTSLALYNYMCQHIVGSEETVKTKRLITTVEDNVRCSERMTIITSGSFGEGLEMEGSDVDFMMVRKKIKVYENISDIEWDVLNSFFEINTFDTKLGFVKLQLRHSFYTDIINLCRSNNGSLFLSNTLFKQYFGKCGLRYNTPCTKYYTEIDHGPCLSDKKGMFDLAFCLQSKAWISQADQWINRPRGPWPSNEVVSTITDHGVLFVPIGVKGSPNEEIEWRISFSVGEKLLIYSFNHTQLLCYALMKIVLKDIINTDISCKDLLCSYYLKNILFWVSEETLQSEWKPRYLVQCFMQCLHRLLYCVEYSLCPHYFIPEINMFENKIEERSRRVLLDKLYTLQKLGWRCILLSPQLSGVNLMLHTYPQSFADYFEQINLSKVFSSLVLSVFYDKAVGAIMFNQSPSIKLYYYLHLLYSCQNKAEEIAPNQTDTNKTLYRKYKTCQSYLVQGLRCNPVSGWLKLASFYYRMKQYRKVLVILTYALSKCTPEMLYGDSELLSSVQRQLLNSKILQRKGLVRGLQLLRLDRVSFHFHSTLIPNELEPEVLFASYPIPPVVFVHFLSFLCHYHLADVRECRNSIINDLQYTILGKYFISCSVDLSVSGNIVGVVCQMIGKNDLARASFQASAKLALNGLLGCAELRLSMMNDVRSD